jgi:hypothetical protein
MDCSLNDSRIIVVSVRSRHHKLRWVEDVSAEDVHMSFDRSVRKTAWREGLIVMKWWRHADEIQRLGLGNGVQAMLIFIAMRVVLESCILGTM